MSNPNTDRRDLRAVETMTPGELLARVKETLDLHKPRTLGDSSVHQCSGCTGTWADNYEPAWPCATVAALTGLPQA